MSAALDRRVALENDEGSILPLIAVFGALVIALALVAVDATSLSIARARLYSAADAAALAGAESFPVDRAAASGSAHPLLEDSEVREAAAQSLAATASTGAGRSGGAAGSGVVQVRLTDAGTPDGRTARVSVSGVWRPPIPLPWVPDGLTIEVVSDARAVFR